MKAITALKGIVTGLYKSIRRFPASILFSISTAVALIVISEMQPIRDANMRETLNRIAMILALGIPVSLCIKLLFEKMGQGNKTRLLLMHGMGFAALILYYFLLLDKLNMVSITRYTGISLVLYLVFLYIPYFPDRENYEKYVIKLLTSFFITAIYSAVLFLGLAAILFTIDRLLGVNISEKVYYYTWLAVVFGFAPPYFLSGVPLYGRKLDAEVFPKLLRILLLYIVMPLLTVYTSILYVYFIKIIVTRQWPIGLVSNLVLWYAVINAAVLFFITPIRNENRWASIYLKWSPRIIMPVLVMMFVSMGIRINAYGVTENRYYVIALGIWVFCVMIYFSLSKKLVNVMLPITLSAIAVISVMGPISSYSVSKWSQNRRFVQILSRNGMLEEGKIKKAGNVPAEDRIEISSILDYFKSNHNLKDVKYLPEDFEMDDMDDVLGFSYQPRQGGIDNGRFNFIMDQMSGPIDIKGYDYLFDGRSLFSGNGDAKSQAYAVYDNDSGKIKISYGGKTVYEKEMSIFADEIIKKYGVVIGKDFIPADDMIFTDENENVKVKYIIMYISGIRDIGTDKTTLDGIEFSVLVKYMD